MSAHTPAPWILVGNGEIVGADERPIAFAAASRMSAEDVLHGRGPANANAKLIAAAPDLYSGAAALLAVMSMADRHKYRPQVDGLIAAHAKAGV